MNVKAPSKPHSSTRDRVSAKSLFGLTRKAHYQVGRQRQPGDGLAPALDQCDVCVPVIATPHGLKYAVAARLHRKMHVLAQLVGCAIKLDQFLGDILGMRSHEPHSLDALHPAGLRNSSAKVSRPAKPGSLP